MRKLGRKQKNIIRKYIKNTYADSSQPSGLSADRPMFYSCERYMEHSIFLEIEAVNDFEIITQCIDHFVDDIRNISDCKTI